MKIHLKGQINQNLDTFYFSSILVKYEPNKHTKYEVSSQLTRFGLGTLTYANFNHVNKTEAR